MEVGELTTVAVDTVLEHASSCPFCQSNEKPAKTPVSKIVNDPDDDPDAELIANDSGELDTNMGATGSPRPTDWIIDTRPIGGGDSSHRIIANPHHLIPGNESLKKAETLLPWIFADKGKIENDIGYNVNNPENGVWLPSNNAMRKDAAVPWKEKAWGDAKYKTKYVVLAMDAAGGHFHDRHNSPFSESVTKVLNKIADRMNGIDAKANCPYKTEAGGSGKYSPPYALVVRLNGVSRRIRGYLAAAAPPQASYYTSKLVLEYWIAKGIVEEDS